MSIVDRIPPPIFAPVFVPLLDIPDLLNLASCSRGLRAALKAETVWQALTRRDFQVLPSPGALDALCREYQEIHDLCAQQHGEPAHAAVVVDALERLRALCHLIAECKTDSPPVTGRPAIIFLL
jgi:hypothetical protein